MLQYRIMYLRDRNKRPVGCIAVSIDRLRCRAEYQYSVLNPLDDFNRKVARQLALGRLIESPIVLSVSRDANMHDISTLVLSDLERRNTAPTRAVKAAKFWLNQSFQTVGVDSLLAATADSVEVD